MEYQSTQSIASKADNSKIIKAGFGYTVGNYLLKGLSFLSVPLFARILTTEDFGLYNTFIAYEGILFVIIGLALHSSYKNAFFKYKNGRYDYRAYVSASMVLIMFSLVLWLLVTNIFHNEIGECLGLTHIELNLLILFSFGSSIITCFNSDKSINYDYKSFLIVSASNAIFNITLSLLLIYTVYDTQRYFGRVVGSVVPVILLACLIIYSNFKKSKPHNLKEFWKWGIVYSLPIIPHGISQIVLSQFDRIMISKMIGPAEAGLYSFAYILNTIILVTATSLETVWLQWFYEKMNEKNEKGIKPFTVLFIAGIALLTSLLILLCPELVLFLGGEKYEPAIYCSIPILLSGFFTFLYYLPAAVEYYNEKTTYIAIATVLAAGINILLNYLFIPLYGYIAAAYTTVITYILYFLFHCVMSIIIQGRFIFPKGPILISITSVLILAFVSYVCIEMMWVRLLIALLLFSIGFYCEEKRYSFVKTKVNNIFSHGKL